MPLIDKPFKRVAIHLVGPIGPPNEVSQESTGFSLFELLYGRAVRGLMFIPRALDERVGGT